MTTTGPIEITTESGRREQRWSFPTDEDSLLKLVHILFEEHWDDIWFGNFAEGAAWEVAAPNAPNASRCSTGMSPSISGAGTSTCASASTPRTGPNWAGSGAARALRCTACST
ncbi:hypothetical protein P9209_12680 [Prescottella defluvii]|nr:hypothetical protein P9209_12680 [Prescottella defluvii]